MIEQTLCFFRQTMAMISISLIGLIGLSTATAGPLVVGQGAGESEFALLFTRRNLPALLISCRQICPLTASQNKLMLDLVELAANPLDARFSDEAPPSAPVFQITADGRHVEFNKNRLWMDPEGTQAFSIAFATSIWVDILAAEQSFDPTDLEQFKSELVKVLDHNMTEVPIEYQGKSPFVALTWKSADGDRVYIRNNELEIVELSAQIADALGCKGPSSIEVHSVRPTTVIPSPDNQLTIRLNTVQNWKCGTESFRGRTMIVLKARHKTDEIYEIDPSSILVFLEVE